MENRKQLQWQNAAPHSRKQFKGTWIVSWHFSYLYETSKQLTLFTFWCTYTIGLPLFLISSKFSMADEVLFCNLYMYIKIIMVWGLSYMCICRKLIWFVAQNLWVTLCLILPMHFLSFHRPGDTNKTYVQYIELVCRTIPSKRFNSIQLSCVGYKLLLI